MKTHTETEGFAIQDTAGGWYLAPDSNVTTAWIEELSSAKIYPDEMAALSDLENIPENAIVIPVLQTAARRWIKAE